ncbi:hypothetical protein AB0F88_39880 [Streptosporangium sp. NPDC023963]|uniref:hypothetical protein n=1 Tax=Streptosporangium sp. NPDC023963 TaxID=3155608 RepID=UPI00343D0F06
MTKILTTHNAEITTATVQVKTLTISGKQVTQSVFRQLFEEPLIAHEGALNGTPWGVVNYHPDKCGDRPEHWHIVWQRGNDLLRSAVDIEVNWPYTSKAANEFMTAVAWETQQEGGTKFFGGKPPKTTTTEFEVHWRCGGLPIISHIDWYVGRVLNQSNPAWNRTPLQPPTKAAAEWMSTLAEEVAKEAARQERHRKLRAPLAELPHLFIAV